MLDCPHYYEVHSFELCLFSAGQRTRFKAFVAIGDYNGHVGLGVKCSKEVATAIRGAIIAAKLSVIPVRRGYWGNKIGEPHTVPCKVRNIFLFWFSQKDR